mmetsp:Transcript_64992/g.136165  ORF Transcript_64992/g.136165 Transcript_64992/m.136165 type:complete len:234 (-) Transcript_64992:291-992(-)
MQRWRRSRKPWSWLSRRRKTRKTRKRQSWQSKVLERRQLRRGRETKAKRRSRRNPMTRRVTTAVDVALRARKRGKRLLPSLDQSQNPSPSPEVHQRRQRKSERHRREGHPGEAEAISQTDANLAQAAAERDLISSKSRRGNGLLLANEIAMAPGGSGRHLEDDVQRAVEGGIERTTAVGTTDAGGDPKVEVGRGNDLEAPRGTTLGELPGHPQSEGRLVAKMGVRERKRVPQR